MRNYSPIDSRALKDGSFAYLAPDPQQRDLIIPLFLNFISCFHSLSRQTAGVSASGSDGLSAALGARVTEH